VETNIVIGSILLYFSPGGTTDEDGIIKSWIFSFGLFRKWNTENDGNWYNTFQGMFRSSFSRTVMLILTINFPYMFILFNTTSTVGAWSSKHSINYLIDKIYL
jgi:hypothetical protein